MARGTTLRRVMQLMEKVGKTIYIANDNGGDEVACRCCGEKASVIYKDGYIDHYGEIKHDQDCIFYYEE